MENKRNEILQYVAVFLVVALCMLGAFWLGMRMNIPDETGYVHTSPETTIFVEMTPEPKPSTEPQEQIIEQPQEPEPTATPEPVVEPEPTPAYIPIPDEQLPQPDKPSDGTVVVVGPEAAPASTPTISGVEATENLLASKIFQLINEERVDAEVRPLTYNNNLQAAADLRAAECAKLFSHTRPDGSPCHTVITEDFYMTGENLIKGEKEIAFAGAMVDAWMSSSGHRNNILQPGYTSTAIGVYEQDGIVYACQIFIG